MKSISPQTNAAREAGQTIAGLYSSDPLAACRLALSATRGHDWKTRLDEINTLLGLHGTEAIRGDWQNGYWCDIVAAYCNTGDSYGLTVIHQRGESRFNEAGRFFIGTMGDFVERNEKKLGIL